MSEQLPAPEFDSQNYARANDGWICGHASEGNACRVGPDNHGRCRAAPECVPVLETKPEQTKGRWRCTRPGSPCETGPLPDGACGRPVARCSPKPTLRTIRRRTTLAVVAATCAILLILLGGPHRENFINPGELSEAHSSEAFAKLHATSNQNGKACAACHVAGESGPAGMLTAALRASPGPLQIVQLAKVEAATKTRIDEACAKCHTQHTLHQATVPTDISCSFCHAEHHGPGRMAAPADTHCAFCHGNATRLMAAAAKGTNLPASRVAHVNAQGRVLDKNGASRWLLSHRSATVPKVIHSFATDHPEFRVHADKAHDPNSLKFGHALHLAGETIPKLPGGKPLECAFCHQPDASGLYFRPVNFEAHCQVCHSLQFDPETPGLNLPHGDVDFVSAFLHSLPKQYADFAGRSGITSADGQREFAQKKVSRLQLQVSSGEEFEQRVFLSTALRGPVANVGTVSGAERALYPGCAYCHEVRSTASGKAEVTKPIMFERWLEHAQFNHATHSSSACVRCHQAQKSEATRDIVLPSKETCIACHSPRGGVVDSCVTCHAYHHKQ